MNELDDMTYLKAVTNGRCVVDFYATWCNPCKVMSETMKDVINSNKFKHLSFYKINVEKSPEATRELGIRSLPTIVFIDKGNEVYRCTGTIPKSMLEEKIKEFFN